MEIDKERFRRILPHLAKELDTEDSKIQMMLHDPDDETNKALLSKKFEGYDPDVIDFIRRCDTEEQATEIIDYLEKRREITSEQAALLRRQIKERGVRGLGPKKEDDYYLRQGGY